MLRRRLLFVLFALGTNMGIKHIIDGAAEAGESEATLRRVRRLYITRDNLRRAIAKLVNATLDVRQNALWGDGTACASEKPRLSGGRMLGVAAIIRQGTSAGRSADTYAR